MRILTRLLAGTFCLFAAAGCLHMDLQPPARPAVPPPASALPVDGAKQSYELDSAAIEPAAAAFQPAVGAAALSLPAEGALELTVEQAVLSALMRNRALAVEQLGPVIAGTFVDTERARFDPIVFAEGSLGSERRSIFDNQTERFFSTDGSNSRLAAGIAKRFLTGTEVSLDLAQSGTSASNQASLDETRAGLNLTQALLRDAGIAPHLAAIRQAEEQAKASVYNLRGFTENLVASVENAYWDYALAVRQVEIFQESFEIAQRQRNDVHARIVVGQLPETEETIANAEMALRRQQLIDARSTMQQARLVLLRLVNPPSAEGWERQIELSEEAVIPEVELGSAQEHETLALKLRPDLNEARLLARRQELETIQTANGLLPRLDLFINLGNTGYARSFSRSFSELGTSNYDLSAGLRFEFPVGNRAATAANLRARAGLLQDLQAIENLKQLIALDIRIALLEVERSLQQIEASAVRRQLQEEVLRSETVRFGVGTSTALDVARTQRDLLESRISEIEAMVNYRQSLINLYLLDGTLLLRRGISGPGAAEVLW